MRNIVTTERQEERAGRGEKERERSRKREKEGERYEGRSARGSAGGTVKEESSVSWVRQRVSKRQTEQQEREVRRVRDRERGEERQLADRQIIEIRHTCGQSLWQEASQTRRHSRLATTSALETALSMYVAAAVSVFLYLHLCTCICISVHVSQPTMKVKCNYALHNAHCTLHISISISLSRKVPSPHLP